MTTQTTTETGWAKIELRFIGGSDWDTADGILQKLNGWTLALETTDGRIRDIRLLQPDIVDGANGDNVGGLRYLLTDDHGEPMDGVEHFVPYEDIVGIGIY